MARADPILFAAIRINNSLHSCWEINREDSSHKKEGEVFNNDRSDMKGGK